MKMLHRTLAGASLAAGIAIALAPMAAAEPGPGVDPYIDRSDQFVAPLTIDAWTTGLDKSLIVSSHGATRIQCRGDGVNVAFYNCIQSDEQNITESLVQIQNPFRPLWINQY